MELQLSNFAFYTSHRHWEDKFMICKVSTYYGNEGHTHKYTWFAISISDMDSGLSTPFEQKN